MGSSKLATVFMMVMAMGIAVTNTATADVPQGQVGQSSLDEVEKSLEDFTTQFRDVSGLFSADDFRTPGSKKYLDKIKFEAPETIVKLNAFKKKLDALQKKMRNLLSLQAVKVGPSQFPRIYKLAQQAARRLEMSDNFHIFILRSPVFNAFTYSYNPEDYDIVLHSAAVENLSDDALLALLGHEMGHVKDQAMISQLVLAASFENNNKDKPAAANQPFYDKMFGEMPQILRNHVAISALDLVATGAVAGLAAFDNESQAQEFARNCELNADRAAVIVTGDAEAPLKLLSAMAYGSKALSAEFSMPELMKQIREVLSNTDNPEDVELLVQSQETHPFNVLRLIEAGDYASSDSFKALKARLGQDAFGKQIDLFTRIVVRTAESQSKFKKYLEERAEKDETLVRLKTKDQFTNQLKRLSDALTELGSIILTHVNNSDLSSKNSVLFEQLFSKMKSERSPILKNLIAPTLINLIEKKLEGVSPEQAGELKAKAQRVKELQELQ